MPDRYRCRVEQATVRPERSKALEDLILKLFERRHHGLIAGREKDWLTVELVQSLREASQVYRNELSTQTSGPLPFALGYFRVRDGTLEVPANVPPKAFVRFLSEFLQPGARLWFGEAEAETGWIVRGVDEVARVTAAGEAQPSDDASAGASA